MPVEIVRNGAPSVLSACCLLALANEGAKIFKKGIAYRTIDVDIIYLHGYGFARERGGPMFQGDLMGLPALLEKLRANNLPPATAISLTSTADRHTFGER